MSEPTVFLIRPHRGGWQCFEAEGVQPYFAEGEAKQQAIAYAQGRLAHRSGTIQVFDATGGLEQSIPFDQRRYCE